MEGHLSPSNGLTSPYIHEFSFTYNTLKKRENDALIVRIIGNTNDLPAQFKCKWKTCRVRLDHEGAFQVEPLPHNPLEGSTFVIRYSTGPKFKVDFGSESFTWLGIEGPDQGRQETDPYHWAEIDSNIYFVSWRENDGTFATMVINLNTAKVRSSGIISGNSWFWEGVIE